MASYIAQYREVLGRTHYIRKASTTHYWFDFTYDKAMNYLQKVGDGFCFVLYGSDTYDDAYVLPYRDVANLFTQQALDDRGRWLGTIRNNIIRLSPGNRSLSIGA